MFIRLQRNHFMLMYTVLLAVRSTNGQNNHQNINSFRNNDKPDDGIAKMAASLFGSRVRQILMNRDDSEKSSSMGETNNGSNGISENNTKYNSLMSTLERNQETAFKAPLPRTSNRKKVKRIQKMKTALRNIRKNISNTLHPIDGNTIRMNSQSMEYSGMDKLHPPKELRSDKDISYPINRLLTNFYKSVGGINAPVGLKGNLPSVIPSPLNINDPVNVLDEHSGNGRSIPCSCFWNKEQCGCSCNDSLIFDDFQELSKSFRPCSNFSFSITGGQHFSLPPNLFTRIAHVQNIHMKITNATFDYLFDATPHASAFRGVTFEKAALIELLGVRVRRGWNWTPLEYLNSSSGAGVEIRLEGCGLRRLSSDFGKVAEGKVRTARISDSRLEMIGSGAFSSFNDLTHFMLPRNRLKSIKRTDLPMEPLNLVQIDLRYNQLQSLEADLFTDMPSLQTISLAGNPLRVLPEATFSSVIGRASVQGLSDFPLYCDCRLRWLKNSSFAQSEVVRRNLNGLVCKRPPHLRGTPLKDLSKEHLMC